MRGKLIVIEGGNGAGKGVQFDLAIARTRASGRQVEPISFPRYETPTGRLVRKMLDGKLGALEPREMATLFASDRAAAKAWMLDRLSRGIDVMSSRYVASAAAYQGARIDDPAGRSVFIDWLESYEYDELGIPRPDLNIVLAVPSSVRISNVDGRGLAKDIHEKDPTFEEKVEAAYHQIATTRPGYVWVDCSKPAGGMHEPAVCHELVWPHIEKLIGAAVTA